jgi:hypothetical protein
MKTLGKGTSRFTLAARNEALRNRTATARERSHDKSGYSLRSLAVAVRLEDPASLNAPTSGQHDRDRLAIEFMFLNKNPC